MAAGSPPISPSGSMIPRRIGPSPCSRLLELAPRPRRWLGWRGETTGKAGMAMTARSGPQLWYGPEMAAHDDWIRHLTAAEIAALEAAVARLDATGIDIAAIG